MIPTRNKSRKKGPMGNPAKVADIPATLESVLSTEELLARPPRPPDYQTENQALLAIAQQLADSPQTTLQKLAEVALEICRAGSAGVSVLSKDTGDFYWPAIAGVWKAHIGGGTPRHFGPSGVVLDRNAAQLFTRPEQYYRYLAPVTPPITEALVTPFYIGENAVGTVWVVAHDPARKFDAEDMRLIESLGRLAAATYPVCAALDTQEKQSQSLRDINEGLLVSSVRQHELAEQAQNAEFAQRESKGRVVAELAERKAAEEALRESEARYRTVFDLGPVAIYSCDASGVIQQFNRRAAELWGRRPADGDTDERFCGSFKLFRPDGSFMPHEQCPMAEVVSGKISETRDAEVHIERPDGSRVTVVVNIRPLKNEIGAITGAVNCFYDITERTRAEEALSESAKRLSFMAESMPQKIFTAKPNGDIEYFNQQWWEFTGVAIDQLRNWGWTQILHADDVGETVRLWKRAIDTGEPFQFVHRLKRADGSYRWHLTRAHAMRDASGRVSMWIGSNTDIHDQREREEQLRETQKLESIGLLAGGIAHDFNNLLTGILGNASMLANHASDSDRPLLDDVVEASERAAGLINQLLAYAGKGQFAITRCDFSQLIAEMLHLIETSIPKIVELRLRLQRDLPLIEADTSQIQQIVMNLVINAAEASGADGGVVSISTGIAEDVAADGGKPGRSVYMKVSDSGSGMDKATLARIFDPFFTTKFYGRGLGLAAVSGIIRSHQGRITVESTPGQGSTFTVFLPAVEAYPVSA